MIAIFPVDTIPFRGEECSACLILSHLVTKQMDYGVCSSVRCLVPVCC